MTFLEIKNDHQGFTVVIGCEFCTQWEEGGMHDIKGGIRAIRLHTDCMCSEMVPTKNLKVAFIVLHSVQLKKK